MADSFGTQALFTADELMLMRSLNPSFVTNEDQDILQERAQSNQAYERALRTGLESLIGVTPDPRFVGTVNSVRDPRVERAIYGDDSDDDDSPDEVKGGFAWAALAPIVGAIAPSLVNSGMKLLSGLFKKRGRGVRAPNGRAGRSAAGSGSAGSGIAPPNLYHPAANPFAKGGRKAFIASIAPRLYQEEDIVRELRGKAFWHELLKLSHKYLKEALTVAKCDKRAATQVMNQLIPLSFQKFVARVDDPKDDKEPQDAEGSGVKSKENQLRSIVRAVCEWVIKEATDGKIKPSVIRPLIDERLKKYDSIEGGSKAGWRNFWNKVKGIAKKVGKAILPTVADIGKNAAPAVIKQILSGVTVTDKNKPWLSIANSMVDTALPTGNRDSPAAAAPTGNGKRVLSPDEKAALVARLKEGKRKAAARRASASAVETPTVSGEGKKRVTLQF